jgi:hypothetical protein
LLIRLLDKTGETQRRSERREEKSAGFLSVAQRPLVSAFIFRPRFEFGKQPDKHASFNRIGLSLAPPMLDLADPVSAKRRK